MHTHGFYDVVKDICRNIKNKKSVIVPVMRVYQQLLEKCHASEWRMLINEVANSYEDENIKQKIDNEQIVEGKDKIIGNLKREILDLQAKLNEKQKEIFSEKEAFTRLHETYMIL